MNKLHKQARDLIMIFIINYRENNRQISKNNRHFFREILKRIMGKKWRIMGSCLPLAPIQSITRGVRAH